MLRALPYSWCILLLLPLQPAVSGGGGGMDGEASRETVVRG